MSTTRITPDTLDVEAMHILEMRIANNIGHVHLMNSYYDGAHRLEALGLSLPPEMDALQTVVNWPGTYADALEERLDVEGFRIGGAARTDDRLWDWWQSNDLDEESGLGHLDAMVVGQSHVTVGQGESASDPPMITVESARWMASDLDQRTRQVRAALRLYDDDESGHPQRAALYRPEYTVYYQRGPGEHAWQEADRMTHRYGMAMAQPLTNRPRLHWRYGMTEMRDVIDLANAACRALTDLQGAQELHALPRNYVLGAEEKDFTDADGNPIPTWEAYIGRLWTLANGDATVGQLGASDLRNFTEVLTLYSRLVAGTTGLPPHYLGLIADNPASADAIRAGEARLVKRAERRTRVFGADWERVMRLGQIVTGGDPNDLRRLETVWRNPATPTYSAKADAVTKLVTSGILPREAAWDELGYGPEYQRRLRSLSSSDPAARYLAMLDRQDSQPQQPQEAPPVQQQPAPVVDDGSAA